MKAPAPKPTYVAAIKNFEGIDLRSAPGKCAMSRSPMCVNMIRDTVGNNRKRHGYETVVTLTGAINGFHTLVVNAQQKYLIHAGTIIYEFDKALEAASVLYTEANDHFSTSRQVGEKLFILDGKELLVYDGTTVAKAAGIAYVPTITIAKTAAGGGTAFEPVNLLTPKRTERFTGDDTSLTFQMGTTDIDEVEVGIKLLQEDGSFVDLVENTDFTVNRTLGTFTLNEAKKTPITGADNLYVTYAKTVNGYAERIGKCDICTLYGLNGQRDRLFVSGNPYFPNYDWYCKSNDPTYFGDTWYSVIGQADSEILGYSIINDNLITHKNSESNDSNAVVRQGGYDANTNQVVFRVVGNYEAAGALGKHTFIMLANEPIYLTKDKSIHAITPSDYSAERNSQERSYYISPELAKESDLELENAYACRYEDFYMLAIGDRVYILDSKQMSYEKNAPYATRQYECYLWTGIGARVIAEFAGRLYFGTADGKVKRFKTEELNGFTDDGVLTERTVTVDGQKVTTKESFPCYWETAEIWTGSGSDHSELKKTFRHLAVALNAYTKTGCRIWAKIDGIWEVIFDYDSSANFFDFGDIDFSDFVFRTDDTPTLVGGKFRAKKVLHIQFRFENSKPQPFSVLFAKTKYTVGNEYRK